MLKKFFYLSRLLSVLIFVSLKPALAEETTKNTNPWAECPEYCVSQMTNEKVQLLELGIKKNNIILVRAAVGSIRAPISSNDRKNLTRSFIKEAQKGFECNHETLFVLSNAGAALSAESLEFSDEDDWKVSSCPSFYHHGLRYLAQNKVSLEALAALLVKIDQINTGFFRQYGLLVADDLRLSTKGPITSKAVAKYISNILGFTTAGNQVYDAIVSSKFQYVNQITDIVTSNPPLAQTLSSLLLENMDHYANLRKFFMKMPIEIKNSNIKGKDLMVQQASRLSSIILNGLDKLEESLQSDLKKSTEEPEPTTANKFRMSST